MKIRNKHDDTIHLDGNIFHDDLGNLILGINDKYYFIDITAKNELEWIEFDNLKLEKEYDDMSYLSIINTTNKLKQKIANELDKSDEDCQNIDLLNYKYHPEDNYFRQEKNYVHNDDIIISKHSDFNIKCFESVLTEPLYDLFVVNKDNKTQLSIESKTKNGYRITVSPDSIQLNIIGSTIRIFSTVFDYDTGDFNLEMQIVRTKCVFD